MPELPTPLTFLAVATLFSVANMNKKMTHKQL